MFTEFDFSFLLLQGLDKGEMGKCMKNICKENSFSRETGHVDPKLKVFIGIIKASCISISKPVCQITS